MAQLPLSIKFTPPYSGYIRIIARPRRDMSIIAANEVFPPGDPNIRKLSVYVPEPGVHYVTIYKTPDGVAQGIQGPSYDAMTDYYRSAFLPDLELEVGRNAQTDPVTGVIIDPANGSTEIEIPYLEGKTVARIHRASASRPMRTGEYALTTTGGAPGLRLLKTNDKFYKGSGPGDVFRIEFAPYYENNTGNAISDLNTLIVNHINDTDNPHEVTKDQVGLGNLPNATSDSYTENDSDKLATAKAVYNLYNAIGGKILGVGSTYLGSAGSISVGGKIVAVENSGGIESKVTINHGFNVSTGVTYRVWAQIMGRSSGHTGGQPNWNVDNDTILVVGNNFTANTFDIFVRRLGIPAQSSVAYLLIQESP